MRKLALIITFLLANTGVAMADFSFTFEWGDIPLCTSGRPGIVPSPKFVVTGVPAGTTAIAFRLTDLDAPHYNHGGGVVPVSGDGVIPPGAFTYKSPCPPGGVHTYQWEAVALDGDVPLATAFARRRYPE